MTNVYAYRGRRRRDPFAKLYVPAILLLGLALARQLDGAPDSDQPSAKAKPAPYIRLQSRSDDEAGSVDAAPRASSTAFRNCTEARAAGYEDIPASSPRYGDHLDSDNDGLGCEPLPRRSR